MKLVVAIVVARTVPETYVIRARRADLGELPVLGVRHVARACMWLNVGAQEDVEKARQWAATQGDEAWRVFVYPADEPDPLGRAKGDVLSLTVTRDTLS